MFGFQKKKKDYSIFIFSVNCGKVFFVELSGSNTEKFCWCPTFWFHLVTGWCFAGAGHILHPVCGGDPARDSREAAEEPQHCPQQQTALPQAGPAGPAQRLPALQAAGHPG